MITNLPESDEDAAVGPVALDPFGFFTGIASRITGLGGSDPGYDPDYVFHTPYVQTARGDVTFQVLFHGLRAKRGTLLLQVNMLSLDGQSHARLVTSVRIQLNRLIQQHQAVSVSFEGFRGVSYAIMGSIPDETDARADAMEVYLDRPAAGDDFAEAIEDARTTVFRSESVRAAPKLISMDRATLTLPVSQMCTASQFEEPAYAEWVAQLQQPIQHHRKQWEFVYILQVLKRYGLLKPGARGVGFGVGREPLPALLASMGAEVVATDLPSGHADMPIWADTDQHAVGIEDLRVPALCGDATFDANVSFRPADMTDIPADLVNFDFTWSSGACGHLGSIAAGLKFVTDSLRCLRPGGLAVHTSEFNLSSDDDTLDKARTVLFRRRDMEQLALTLISRGHEVAQIKLDGGNRPIDYQVDGPPCANDPHLRMAVAKYATTSFGFIVRRATSPL